MKRNESGATLIELLIAVVMIASVVTAVALIFPKATASITQNRQKLLATNLAASGAQDLKQEPYPLVALTTTTYFTNQAINGGCDCSQEMNHMPISATFVEDGITYQRRDCIHMVKQNAGAGWDSVCPNATHSNDTNMKNIRVRISWTRNGSGYSTDTESMVSRCSQ